MTVAVPDGWAPADVDEDAVWTIIYTSGTTGLPKGVQATHGGVLASMLGILVAHGVSAASRCLTVLPTFHVAGLNLFANPVLYAGGTVVVARAFDPAQTLALLTDDVTPMTHFCGVPANYQFMEHLPEFADAPLRPFVAVVGGLAGPVVPGGVLGGARDRADHRLRHHRGGRLRHRHAAGAGTQPQRHDRPAAAVRALPGAHRRRPAGRAGRDRANCRSPGRWSRRATGATRRDRRRVHRGRLVAHRRRRPR